MVAVAHGVRKHNAFGRHNEQHGPAIGDGLLTVWHFDSALHARVYVERQAERIRVGVVGVLVERQFNALLGDEQRSVGISVVACGRAHHRHSGGGAIAHERDAPLVHSAREQCRVSFQVVFTIDTLGRRTATRCWIQHIRWQRFL